MDVLCLRHGAIVTNREHGIRYCMACFGEARHAAVIEEVDEFIREGRRPQPLTFAEWFARHKGHM